MNHSTLLLNIARLVLASLVLVSIISCNNKLATRKTSSGEASGPAAATQTTTHQATGTVKALDLKGPTIDIDHGDIEGLMPAMEMEFSVSNAALLNGISVGDRIEFQVTNSVGGLQVTSIKKL
jgi:Cu(I)/Ag(I) efflux system periplasmic protein CusF